MLVENPYVNSEFRELEWVQAVLFKSVQLYVYCWHSAKNDENGFGTIESVFPCT